MGDVEWREKSSYQFSFRSPVNLDSMTVSQRDLRVLEVLTLKYSKNERAKLHLNTSNFRTSKEQESDRQKMLLQMHWESELESRLRRQIELRNEFEKKLSLKRQLEAEERARRLQSSKEDYLRCQEHLRNLLKEKDFVNDNHLQNIRKLKVIIRQ